MKLKPTRRISKLTNSRLINIRNYRERAQAYVNKSVQINFDHYSVLEQFLAGLQLRHV